MEYNKDEARNKFILENPSYSPKRKSIYKYHKYTKRTKEEWREHQRRRKLKYPEKIKARSLLMSAIRWGRIKRGPCEVCGEKKSEGHHDDYSKPLEVKWLCMKHHREYHKLSTLDVSLRMGV